MKYKTNKQNPWNWGFPEQKVLISLQQQRCAEYNETSDPNFKGNSIAAFFSQEMPPMPQVANVCGIKCPNCGC